MRLIEKCILGVFAACGSVSLYAEGLSEKEFLEDLPVVQSASRLRQPLNDAPASVTVIDRETIRRSGYRSIPELLKLVPGFLVTHFDGGARPYATYHGDSDVYNRHLQVYVDGRSLYSGLFLGSATYALLGVPLEEIERIEVIRGSNSASQGANAYLGVLNIITRHAADSVGGRVSVGSGAGGDGGINDGTFRYGWASGAGHYRVTVENRHDSGFDNRYDTSTRKSLTGRADLRLSERDELTATLGGFDFDWGSNVGSLPRSERYRNGYARTEWRRTLSPDSELKAGVFFEEEQFFDFAIGDRIDGSGRRQGGELQYMFSPVSTVRVVLGSEYRSEHLHSSYLFRTSPDQGSSLHRVFGNIEWTPNERWTFNLGELLERHSIVGSHRSPRLGANLKLTPDQMVRVAQSTNYSFPNQFALRGNWKVGGFVPFVRATGNARPERIDVSEVGYLGEFRKIGLGIDVRGFVEKSRGVLSFFVPPGGTANDLVLKDPFKQQGWETRIRWRPWDGTELIANHTELRLLPNPGSQADVRAAPRHFSSVAWFQDLPHDVTLSVMTGHVESYRLAFTPVPATHQLDLRLAKRFRLGSHRAEAALNATAVNGPHWSYTSNAAAGTWVDRRVFGTLTLDF